MTEDASMIRRFPARVASNLATGNESHRYHSHLSKCPSPVGDCYQQHRGQAISGLRAIVAPEPSAMPQVGNHTMRPPQPRKPTRLAARHFRPLWKSQNPFHHVCCVVGNGVVITPRSRRSTRVFDSQVRALFTHHHHADCNLRR